MDSTSTRIDWSYIIYLTRKLGMKIDVTRYSSQGILFLYTSIKKWRITVNKSGKIEKVEYTYREYKQPNWHRMKSAPIQSICGFIVYAYRSDTHVPNIELNDEDSIIGYANRCGLDVQIAEYSLYITSPMGRWRVEHDGENIKRVLHENLYERIYTKTKMRQHYHEQKYAPKRNIGALLFYIKSHDKQKLSCLS